MSRKRKQPRSSKTPPSRGAASPPQQFFAQPPPDGVPHEEWARAFLEAQSPNPEVRQRGRNALTQMGCAFMDGSPPAASG